MTDNGKTVAILSYITIIGWIIALIMNHNKKTSLGSFHIRQALIIMLTNLVLIWIPFIGRILNIIIFVFWIIGLVYAIQEKEKLVPIIGQYAQEWFKGL